MKKKEMSAVLEARDLHSQAISTKIVLSAVWFHHQKEKTAIVYSVQLKKNKILQDSDTLFQKKSSQNTKNVIMFYKHQQTAFLKKLVIMLSCFKKLLL